MKPLFKFEEGLFWFSQLNGKYNHNRKLAFFFFVRIIHIYPLNPDVLRVMLRINAIKNIQHKK